MPDILVNTIVFAATTLSALLRIYVWIVIIAALLSWVHPDPYNPIVRTLYGMTEAGGKCNLGVIYSIALP